MKIIKEWWWVPILVLVFALCAYGLFKFTEHLSTREHAAIKSRHNHLFKAWCKQYGNPNRLTLNEFKESRVQVGWLNGTVLPPVGYKKRRSK